MQKVELRTYRRPIPPRRWTTFVLAATVLVGQTSSFARAVDEAAKSREYLPLQLRLRIGGVFGQSYLVEWRDDRLIYLAGRGPTPSDKDPYVKRKEITPSREAWQKFWRELDAVRMDRWKARYVDPAVSDGTGWDILIERSGKRRQHREIHGENAYPKDRDVVGVGKALDENGQNTPIFRRYLAAVRELLGGESFQ